jgi:hypothetical protein
VGPVSSVGAWFKAETELRKRDDAAEVVEHAAAALADVDPVELETAAAGRERAAGAGNAGDREVLSGAARRGAIL